MGIRLGATHGGLRPPQSFSTNQRTQTLFMPLNLSLTADAVSGRRTFLIGTAASTFSMILPWATGMTLGFFGNSYASANGFLVGAWLIYLMVVPLPFGFLAARQAIPRWARILSLALCAYVIITETLQAVCGGPMTAGLTVVNPGGPGQWLFIAAQILSAIAIARFPRLRTMPTSTPPPLP